MPKASTIPFNHADVSELADQLRHLGDGYLTMAEAMAELQPHIAEKLQQRVSWTDIHAHICAFAESKGRSFPFTMSALRCHYYRAFSKRKDV